MSTVDWTDPDGEGLRARKKRWTRQRLTDTATEMFVERGFDAVRVAEIAAACGVSEKTVYNYFPTKESLVVDHPEAAIAALRAGLADASRTPTRAVLDILDGERSAIARWLADQDDPDAARKRFSRFAALVEATPQLRAYHRDMTDRLVAVAAEGLAARAGMGPDEPEPWIAAAALVGLWRVQFAALSRHLAGPLDLDAVAAEVRRAAVVIDGGVADWCRRQHIRVPDPDGG